MKKNTKKESGLLLLLLLKESEVAEVKEKKLRIDIARKAREMERNETVARKKQERGDNKTAASSRFSACSVEDVYAPSIFDVCCDVTRTEATLSLADATSALVVSERPVLLQDLTIAAEVGVDDSLDEHPQQVISGERVSCPHQNTDYQNYMTTV